MSFEIFRFESFVFVEYGFFICKGGVFLGIFYGLNCGIGSSDFVDIVCIN